MDDMISRQATIGALDALCDRECEYSKQQRSFMCGACRLGSAFDVIDELPSAQLEPLTDKEQRIFLAAMGREEKVCKQVDEEWRDCREPYEDSLVSVCNEIERKVKGALWDGK